MTDTANENALKLFEVTLPGFDGGTDETDHLVVWLAAASERDVMDAIGSSDARFCGPVPAGIDEADFRLPADLDGFHERLAEAAPPVPGI